MMMHIFTLPNVLSLSRVLLAIPTAYTLVHGWAVVTTALYIVVIASDLIDGRIARNRQQISAFGTLIDHGSDAAFVVVLCAAGAWLGRLPLALPLLIFIAFMQYALDSRSVASGEVRGSRLGRLNGVAYFVIVGALIIVQSFLSDEVFRTTLHGFGWLLVVSTLTSMVARATHTIRVPHIS